MEHTQATQPKRSRPHGPRRRVTPVFTRRNRFRLRWYILHRGKRLRRREVRALRRILEDMK